MLPTSLCVCVVGPCWKKFTQKAHSASTCYWPLQPQCKTNASLNKPPITYREGRQCAQHQLCGNVDQLLRCCDGGSSSRHSPCQGRIPHLSRALRPTLSLGAPHPSFCWTLSSDILFIIRSCKALRTETVSLSLMHFHKIWASIPFETSNSKLNCGTFEIRCWMERKLLATSAWLLHRDMFWRSPSEMQPNIILVSPLLMQSTPAQFQILDVCLSPVFIQVAKYNSLL